MEYLNFCCLIGVFLSLLHASPCGANSSVPSPADQNTAVLLNRVLHSEEGHGIRPVTVAYVTPYVRPASLPPLKLHKRIPTDKLYLITRTGVFCSFLLTPTLVHLQWQAKLVPDFDKTAMEPTGPLGRLLEGAGKRIPNHAAIGKHGNGGSFLSDMDNPSPLILYHLVEGGLVRADE